MDVGLENLGIGHISEQKGTNPLSMKGWIGCWRQMIEEGDEYGSMCG